VYRFGYGGRSHDGYDDDDVDADAAGTPHLPERAGWASRTELRWLRNFGLWNRALNASLRKLDEVAADADRVRPLATGDDDAIAAYERLVRPLRDCEETLAAEVPPPPTERLDKGLALIEVACVHHARAAGASLAAYEDGDPAKLGEANAARDRARMAIALANETIPPGEGQPLPVLDRSSHRSRVNPRYGVAAARVVGSPTEVRCWSWADWRRLVREHRTLAPWLPATFAGVTGIGSSRVNLSPPICRYLDALVYENYRPRAGLQKRRLAGSVGLLAHESQHRAGIVDEAVAECYGLQLLSEAAQALGAPRRYADELARLAWSHYGDLPTLYRSSQCRDDGRLDLEPSSGASWP
jgi:hypothetical protein